MSKRSNPPVGLVTDDSTVCKAINAILKADRLQVITFNRATEFLASFASYRLGTIVLVQLPVKEGTG